MQKRGAAARVADNEDRPVDSLFAVAWVDEPRADCHRTRHRDRVDQVPEPIARHRIHVIVQEADQVTPGNGHALYAVRATAARQRSRCSRPLWFRTMIETSGPRSFAAGMAFR